MPGPLIWPNGRGELRSPRVLLGLAGMVRLWVSGSRRDAFPGTVAIDLPGVTAGVGHGWGQGALRFQGRRDLFGDPEGQDGIATVGAAANFYDLKNQSAAR
jgi:hypothetical protein